MNTSEQIDAYIATLEGQKRADMEILHQHLVQMLPKKLWFLDGKDGIGKVISNPCIGYGQFNIRYKDGSTKPFYQIGISSNSTGISVYIMGIEDKKYLTESYGSTIGKASITSYCIKFRKLSDINLTILDNALKSGLAQTDSQPNM